MIFNKILKKPLEKALRKAQHKIGYSMTYEQKEKQIKKYMGAYMFITTVAISIFLMYFFTGSVLTRLGFEKTAVLLLTIIMIIMKTKN